LFILHKGQLLNDEELIKACLKKDAKAERQLWNRFAPKMMGVCHRYASSDAEADDMLQESFIKIFMNLKNFKHLSAFETWVTGITINTCLTYLRLNKKLALGTHTDHIENDAGFSTEQLHYIDSNMLLECIRQLPETYRTILNLFAIDGYSHKEIAAMLHISEGASRINCFRAKSMLEQKLKKINLIEKQHGAK
jgi:RNA polymerase sigma-70 factor (ECF subfamily)